MTSFLQWRGMSWVLVLWSGYVAIWAVLTRPGPAVVTLLWWLLGMSVFGALWLVTQPPFQQWCGHKREALTLVVGDGHGQSLPEER
jgi:hypothetical protein